MSDTTNWRPDPYGFHEFRFFSDDGKPTLLVMDGGKTSYDKPPPVDPPAILEPHGSRPDASIENHGPRHLLEAGSSTLPSAPPAKRSETLDTQANRSVPFNAPLGAITSASEERLAPATAQKDPVVVVVPQRAYPARRDMEPIGRPLKIAFGIVFGLLAVSALGFLIVHLPHSANSSPERAAINTSTTAPAHDSTTTTLALPTAPKPSAEAAAETLVTGWSTGNRLVALSVATPAAATTLFAAPYASGLAIDRGCSTSFTPIVCTFGPPGGASPNDPIYEVFVNHSSGGWYVSSVKIER